jgi:hypothetical protein
MTEQEWLLCDQPQAMLDSLPDNASGRKLRLFACYCCRRVWNLLAHEWSKDAIEVAERYADGEATSVELEFAARAASEAEYDGKKAGGYYASQSAFFVADDSPEFSARQSADSAAAAIRERDESEAEVPVQAAFLHDIFGNPFHPLVADPSWRTTNVVGLAYAIYADRAFDRMPILGDALEDAGCDNADILNHCRQSGEHVRGCWVVDLILGKS